MNDKAQIHTLEGFFAATLMVLTIMLITKSAVIITPQSELAMDVQLKQTAEDALAVLDIAPETALQYNLTELVAGWDMTDESLNNNHLNDEIYAEIGKPPENVMYSVDFAYVNETTGILTVGHPIRKINGVPIENSMVATRLVTLYNSTVVQEGGKWPMSNNVTAPNNLTVVEVRLIVWRV